MTTIEKPDITTPALPAPSGLEKTLAAAARRLFAQRHNEPGTPVDLEALADRIIKAAILEQHGDVLAMAENPGRPTAQEHRWALSLAGAVANRFQRTARGVLRGLKAQQTTDTRPGRDADGCPAWCVKKHGDDDFCEGAPVSMTGPGDWYDEQPERYEVLWACLSETPQNEVAAGAQPGPYVYVDTLAVGQGWRCNVADMDALINDMGQHMARLQALRDQLADLTETP